MLSVGPSTVSVCRSFLLGGSDSRHSPTWRVDCGCQVLGSKTGLGKLTTVAAGCPQGFTCMLAALVQCWTRALRTVALRFKVGGREQGVWLLLPCTSRPATGSFGGSEVPQIQKPEAPQQKLPSSLRFQLPQACAPLAHQLSNFLLCLLFSPTSVPVGLCLSGTLSSHSSGPGQGVGSTHKSSPACSGVRARRHTGYWQVAPGSPSVKGPLGSPLPDGPHARLPTDAHASCARLWGGFPPS